MAHKDYTHGKKYFHLTCFESSKIVYDYFEVVSKLYYSDSNFYGPFATFTEAKQDAIDYHKATMETARSAIHDIKNIKKRDVIGESSD